VPNATTNPSHSEPTAANVHVARKGNLLVTGPPMHLEVYVDDLARQEQRLLSRGAVVVGDTGFEPVTSSVSGKRATAAPIARGGDGI
jgi:hypothetical protein